MTLSDLSSLATVFSGAAVLVSLIYLGLQTRQNAKHAKALIHQGRSALAVDWINTIASDPSLMEAVVRGLDGDQTLDDIQAARFIYVQTSQIYSIEDNFLQHREGLIEDGRQRISVT